MISTVTKVPLALMITLFTTELPCAQAQNVPIDLQGSYSSNSKLCSGEPQFSIQSRLMFGEGMGCDVISIKRLTGTPGEDSSFNVVLSCHMDDPEKPKLSGILALQQIDSNWHLGVSLQVDRKYRRKFAYPPLQMFRKCK